MSISYSPNQLGHLHGEALLTWLSTQPYLHHSFRTAHEKSILRLINLPPGCSWLNWDVNHWLTTILQTVKLRILDPGPQDNVHVTMPQVHACLQQLIYLSHELRCRGVHGGLYVAPLIRKCLKDTFALTWGKDEYKAASFFSAFGLPTTLPLFAPPELRPSTGFSYTSEGPTMTFSYFGRTSLFRQLATLVTTMHPSNFRKLSISGPLGSGKSHALAALAVHLVANGKRVVFIPSCRLLALRPVTMLRDGLSLAFADSEDELARIGKVETEEGVKALCEQLGEEGTVVHFLVDQVEGLEPDEYTGGTDGVSNGRKEGVRLLLEWISTGHVTIQCGTGNGRGRVAREASEKVFFFSGGLDEDEMQSWWNHPSFGQSWGALIGPTGRKEIEALTGNLPFFLDTITDLSTEPAPANLASILNPQDPTEVTTLHERNTQFLTTHLWNSEKVEGVARQINTFSLHLRDSLRHKPLLASSYAPTLDCCLTKAAAPTGIPVHALLDHRFQYIDNSNVGAISGGVLVSQCYARILRTLNCGETLLGPCWFNAITQGLNRSVVGFLAENMCISWISCHGLAALEIPPSCNVIPFQGDLPPIHCHDEALAIPERFNFPHVDAVYWKKMRDASAGSGVSVRIVGLQFTLQHWEKHSEAEAPFFARAREWVEADGSKASFEFAWLVETRQTADLSVADIPEEVDADGTITAPEFVRHVIEIREFADRIGRKLALARGIEYVPASESVPLKSASRRKQTKSSKKSVAAPASTTGKRKFSCRKKAVRSAGSDEEESDGEDSTTTAAQTSKKQRKTSTKTTTGTQPGRRSERLQTSQPSARKYS